MNKMKICQSLVFLGLLAVSLAGAQLEVCQGAGEERAKTLLQRAYKIEIFAKDYLPGRSKKVTIWKKGEIEKIAATISPAVNKSIGYVDCQYDVLVLFISENDTNGLMISTRCAYMTDTRNIIGCTKKYENQLEKLVRKAQLHGERDTTTWKKCHIQ